MRRALVALLLAGCAGSPRAGGDLDRDRDRDHPAVAYLSSDCSGVLVAPDRILTAAHCVTGARDLRATFESRGARRTVAIAGCAMHPGALETGDTDCAIAREGAATIAEHDLAVLALAEPVPRAIAAPIRALLGAPFVSERAWWRGARILLVGWQRRPALLGAPHRYGGWNDVREVRGAVIEAAPRDGTELRTEVGMSGGPGIVTIDGEEWIVGVLFGGTAPGSPESVLAATFDPDNSGWLLRAIPSLEPMPQVAADPAAP